MARTPLEQESAGEALFRLADWTNCTGDASFRGLARGLAEVLSVRWVFSASSIRTNPVTCK